MELDKLLSQREKINHTLQKNVDEHIDPWGIKVTAVETKDIELPEGMKRAMAKQPSSLQLRYLQTLTEVAVEKNSTILFPLPIDLVKPFLENFTSKESKNK
jgi:hypothetical protein